MDGSNSTIKNVGPGQYMVNCTQSQPDPVILNINDGKQNKKIPIPVRRIPDPLALVGESAGGTMSANAFRGTRGVLTELKEFVYEGVKFQVVSFIVVATGKGFENGPEFAEVDGNKYNAKAISLISRCQAGTTVTIGEIKVSEPDGKGTRKLRQTIPFILQ